MSAYIVGKEVIDQIVAAADLAVAEGYYTPIYFGEGSELSYPARSFGPNDLGRLLWVENLKSVADRYPDDGDGERPGPDGFRDKEAEEYVFAPVNRTPKVVAGLKLLDGYEYQSCEHKGWTTSAACSFVEALRRRLISILPGYEEAPWV